MTLADYQQTKAYQGAIALGSELIKLAEQLPEAEQLGLGQQLRQLMVELPGGIALDLIDGTGVRLPLALRLSAALELVEHIYPALDAAPARTALAALTERLVSDGFTEQVIAPVAEAPEPEAALVDPAEVAVLADPALATSVAVATEGTGGVYVQPNSGQ
jgi:hypothetical protein